MKTTINISTDFSKFPGPRNEKDGAYSAELFYNKSLFPAMFDCQQADTMLTVVLDGTEGFAISFIDEAFGRLTLNFTEKQIKEHLTIISTEEPDMATSAWTAINRWHKSGIHKNSVLYDINSHK